MNQKFIFVFLAFIIISTQTFITVSSDDDEDEHDSFHHNKPDDSDNSHKHYDTHGHHNDDFDHDAVSGSHHETETFKSLEPDEAKKRLGILFDKMDLDKDRLLTKAELFQWIIQSFKNLDKEEAEKQLDDFDRNHDGLVSWDEYVHKTYGHDSKELNDIIKTNASDMHTFIEGVVLDKLRFTLADVNKNGTLEMDEFVKFLHPQNYPEMGEYEYMRTLEDFDKNRDGVLDLKEFLGDEKMDQETKEHETLTFKEHDKNNNAVLEKNEIIAWAMPGFDKSAKAEVEHLFNETDTNHDKLLNKDEVVAQHELWVGSQATDYGKHLDDMKHDEL